MSKTTIDRKVLERAIEALRWGAGFDKRQKSRVALRDALETNSETVSAMAQPQQEPVGEVTDALGDAFKCEFKGPLSVGTKLYTSPPDRNPLTAGDRDKVFDRADKRMQSNTNTSWRNAIVDEVEAAHGIK